VGAEGVFVAVIVPNSGPGEGIGVAADHRDDVIPVEVVGIVERPRRRFPAVKPECWGVSADGAESVGMLERQVVGAEATHRDARRERGSGRFIRGQVSVARVSSDWINVGDAEREGLAKLERGTRDYFAGGAGDEITLRENVEAWGRWRLRPRVLKDVREVSTTAEVLGAPVSMPVLVAPVAYQRMAHPEAEAGMAAGAAEAGTVMCLSTLSTTRPGEVAAAAPEGRRWFQLTPSGTRG
jgi:hypothetical protein